jgi:hypothetical protein
MKAEDLLSEGEKAKRQLRVAQALALLTKSRKPSLAEVKAATTRLQAKQPAVALAIIMDYAKRQPLHERGDWLQAAAQALREYRLGDGADQKEAELAHEHIDHERGLHKAELARIKKMREGLSLALLCLLVTLMLATLGYYGYQFLQGIKQDAKEPAKSPVEKSADKKPDPKPATEKTPPASAKAETKPAEPEKKTAKPSGK